MALTRMLGLFAAILLLSTGIAFLGYHYLKLASEYRKNNFIHLSETQRAMDYLEEHPKLEKSEMEVLRAHVAAAQAQAIWCVANLSALETRAFHWLGVGSALDICKYDIRTSELLLARLNGLIESNDARHIVQTTPYLVFYFKRGLLRMREDSFAFQPFVDIIEGKLGLLVKISTLIASTGLGLLFSLVAAKLVRAWRSQSDQTIEMQRMAQRFSLAIQASSDGFALFNKERVLLTCNDRYRELSHPNPAFIRDGMTAIEIMNDAADKGFYQTNGLDTADFVSGHVLQMRSDHDDVQLEISDDRHVLVRFSQTEFGDQVITRTNITDAVRNARKQREYTRTLKKAKDAVERQSLTDPLTGLANRRQLDVALHAQMEIGPASLIRIDLDRFKQVNDVLGHDAGDHVLRIVAKLLTEHTREDDLPARVGGDEFVVLCAPGTQLQDATILASRLLHAIKHPVSYGKKRCIFGASFGIAIGDPSITAPSELLSNADAALYQAKADSRGKIVNFSNDMRKAAKQERAHADRFMQALGDGGFVPYFQTQHDARTWKLSGVEVLARWEHPIDGVLSPVKFLGIAKQLGLEAELDTVIFEAAERAVAVLKTAGIILPRVAFNVSASRIIDPLFLQHLKLIPHEKRKGYVFEILESISYEDASQHLVMAIDTLKDMGFKVDVDDFGSGHASINSVLSIEPDSLKIDRRIISPLGKSERAGQMVSSIIELARSMNARVIAEGVDSEEKAIILREKGCDELQGYFFSQPMSAAALAQNMTTYNNRGAATAAQQ